MNRQAGFTLTEIMIAIAIVAIIVALAIPGYSQWVRKANRGEAQALMLNWANNQEVWRSNNPTYASATDVAKPTHEKYSFADPADVSATTFTLTAVAQGNQASDSEQSTSCTTLTLDQDGARTPAVCWKD